MEPDRPSRTIRPISGKYVLFIKEKFYIMFRPTSADLNSRSEIFSNCRDKISKLLIKERERKTTRIDPDQDLEINFRII